MRSCKRTFIDYPHTKSTPTGVACDASDDGADGAMGLGFGWQRSGVEIWLPSIKMLAGRPVKRTSRSECDRRFERVSLKARQKKRTANT